MSIVRDTAVILLAAEAFLFALVPLALFAALVYGVWRLRLHPNMPTWLRKAREYLLLGLSYVDRAMDMASKPVVVVHRTAARLEGSARGLQGRATGRETRPRV